MRIDRLRMPCAGIVFIFAGSLPAGAQDLDRGKSPSQLFSSNCTACHRGPQGLFRGSVGTTAGFLRQHYTTSAESAGALAAYLASVGGDPRTARIRMPSAGPEGESRAGQEQRREGEERREGAQADAPPAPAGRKRGEPAVVSSDPPNIITAPYPVPLEPSRAPARSTPPAAQSARAATAPATSLANNAAAIPAPDAVPSAAAPKPSDEEIAAQEGFSSPLP